MTQKLAANYSHQVSALLTAYRLLDLQSLYDSDGRNHPRKLLPLYPNCITPQMIKKDTVKVRWRKLDNWQDLLIEFRDLFKGVSLGEEAFVSIGESPFCGSLAHLQGLADSHSNQKWASIVQNFRGAALHWTVLRETAHLDTQKLPTIPESISDIVGPETLLLLSKYYQPHTYEKMDAYLREHRQGELVLPLHLSLMLTPCFLLMLTTLVKSKFPQQSIYQVSTQPIIFIPEF